MSAAIPFGKNAMLQDGQPCASCGKTVPVVCELTFARRSICEACARKIVARFDASRAVIARFEGRDPNTVPASTGSATTRHNRGRKAS